MDCTNPSQCSHKPQESPPEKERAVTDSTRKRAAHMAKFKEAVMKLLITAQRTPFSETQNSLLEERVSQFISLLHTPDHPPYAWMIERALQELNDTGGSSEDSISKFIRKEYDELPRSHFTILKYHLAQLCESGELVLTSGQRYLVAAANSDRKIRMKSRRKSVKRKKGSDGGIMRSKRRRKAAWGKNMLLEVDKVEVPFSLQKDTVTSKEMHEDECVAEENEQPKLKKNDIEMLCSQQKYQITSKDVHGHEVSVLEGNKPQMLKSDEVINEDEDCLMEGSEHPKFEAEAKTSMVKLCVAKGNGVHCNSVVPSNVTPSLLITDGENNLPKFGMQQRTDEPNIVTMGISSRDAQLDLGWKQLEVNHTELATPEKPPGFESVTFERSSQFHPQTAVSSKFQVHPEQLNQNCAHDFSDAGGKTSEPEIIDNEKLLHTERAKRYMRRLKSKVAQANQTSRVLRSQVRKQELSKAETSATFLASDDHHERLKPECQIHQEMLPEAKPDPEVPDELTPRIHQAKQDLALKGPKSNPSKCATGDKLFPKHDPQKKQLGFCGRGQPPKASMPTKATPGRPLIGDIAPLNDQDQQYHAWPLLENSDITFTEMLLLKPVDDLQLAQQLEKPRLGRTPKGDASTVVKSNLKHKTTYRGRGRPRLTDRRD